MTPKIGTLTKVGLVFPGLCFIHAFDQTLAEQLYRDKGLLWCCLLSLKVGRNSRGDMPYGCLSERRGLYVSRSDVRLNRS